MSVIIRLQNLPWSANSLDIRHYFRGLSIPEGGVHIVGGEMGDAFIAFSTDEDARQAMMMTGGKIKEVQISLMLSSRNEMQKVIEAARQASMTNSLAQLLGTQNVSGIQMGQQQPGGGLPLHLQQQHLLAKDRRESRDDKKDSSDVSTSSYDTVRRDKKEKSRSRSRDRMRKDRRDRDRDRDRRKRSRSRSRSRERRRRRSHSRSRGRDRERKDVRDDLKKDKDVGAPNANIQDAGNLANVDILNQNQWRMVNPSAAPQNTPVINSINNVDLMRSFSGAKTLLQGNTLSAGPLPLMGNELSQDRFPSISAGEEIGFGNRGRGGDFPSSNPSRRDNRENFNRDSNSRDGMPDNAPRGNLRNFDNGNSQGFQGNFPYGGANHLSNNFGNVSGYQQRNGNDGMNPNRYNNYNSADGYPPLLGNSNSRDQRGLLDFPVGIPSEGFNSRNDRFDPNRDDRVDEFGRSIQLRNRKKNTEDTFKDEDFSRNQPGNFSAFQGRFGNNQGSGPPPLLRGRDSWPPNRQGDGFPDRRGFRGGFDDGGRGSFRNDFSDGRPSMRGRRDDFHPRDRPRFGEKRDESKFERDCCVEIRGLAPGIAYGDVRRPFNSLKVIIKDIKFFDYTKTDKKCRLRFLNHDNKKKALQNTKKIVIESKQVQLLHINDTEFDECVDEGVRRPDARFSEDEDEVASTVEAFLQVKDLEPEHVESDIAKLLSPAVTNKIIFETSPDGKNKTALVRFEKAVDAKVALGTPSRKIGEHSVMLMPLSEKDFNDKIKKLENGASDGDDAETGKQEGEAMVIEDDDKSEAGTKDGATDCIIMRNLPFEASDRDICDFFSDIGLVPKRIHLMLDSRGQPSGEAFCEFAESEQAQTACSKNGMPLGKSSLVVQKVPRSDMNAALGMKSDGEDPSGPDPHGSNHEGVGRPQCVVAVENIPFRAGVFDIINFFGWSYRLTEEDIIRKYNDRGQPTGDARVAFRTPEDALKAVRFLNNRSLMGRPIRMKIL